MRRIVLLAALLVVSILVVAQNGSRPTTPEERQRAIELAKKLEADPLDKSLKPDCAWLMKWAADAPDFTVSVCASHGEFKKNYKYSPELTFQKMAAGVAFVLQHPEQQNDRVAQELAAVNGALNAYEAILKADPKRHSEYWDDLLKRRDAGTLKDFVTEYVIRECSGNGTRT